MTVSNPQQTYARMEGTSLRFRIRRLIFNVILTLGLVLGHNGLIATAVLRVDTLNQVTCTVSWVLNADGFWDDAGNWSTNAVPGASDNVCIDVAGGVTVTHRQDTSTVNSVQSEEALVLSGGTLDVSTSIQVNSTFQLNGGTLRNATVLPGTGGEGLIVAPGYNNRLVEVTLEGDLFLPAATAAILRVANGLTLNGTVHMGDNASTIAFEGTQTLDGNGTIVFEATNSSSNRSSLVAQSSGTLTIGADITVRGARGSIGFITGPWGPVRLDVVNQGTIAADVSGHTIFVGSDLSTFTNLGTIEANNGGTLSVNTLNGNSGTALVNNGGQLNLDGNYTIDQAIDVPSGSTLALRGVWSNAAVISATNATLTLEGDWFNAAVINSTGTTTNLGGTFTLADLGTFNQSGGSVNLFGTLDNRTTTLALDADTGDWQLDGGTILGGTITTADGAGLYVAPGYNNRLVGVTLEGDLFLPAGTPAILRIGNGLTLNGTMHLGDNLSIVAFEGTQTLDGSGTIAFEATSTNTSSTARLVAQSSGTLTIGPGITVRGARGSIGYITGPWGPERLDVINQGTIAADVSGHAITIGSDLTTITNQGTIEANNGGTLSVNSTVTLSGMGRLAAQPSGIFGIAEDLVGDTNNAQSYVPLGTTRFDGSGSSTDPQLLEVMSQDLGNSLTGFNDNFAYGAFQLDNNTVVRLVDQADNATGAGPEALYVNAVIVPAGTTLDLNGFHLYARAAQIGGTVLGGNIDLIPDGGPLDFGEATPGAIAVPGELDEWTFFGRAGQSVTLLANPGAGDPPEPVSPPLNWVEVSLVDADDNILATASNSQSGVLVTLGDVSLPVDGIYRIRVQAPAGQAGSSGNYLLTLWDSSADEATLQLNQRVTGRIETPFNVDRWHFAAVAGQQLRFDLANHSSAGLWFRLTGPGGTILFEDLAADSGLLNLTASGDYVLTAYGSAGQIGDYAFTLLQTSQIDLALNTIYNGTLAGSGQAQLFRVEVSQSTPLLVTLDDSSAQNHNELYLRLGSPPNRSDSQYRFSTPQAADQQILVPMAAPGTWYILLYGEAVPASSNYTLLAASADVFLTGVTPNRISDSAEGQLTIGGAGFDGVTAVELLSSGGTPYPAGDFEVYSPQSLAANFPGGSVPPGTYSLRVTTAGGGSVQLDDALTVVAGGEAQLETNIILPEVLGNHIFAELYVEYGNEGDVAMPAPVLTLHGSDQALLTLDRSLIIGGFSTADRPDGFRDSVQILAFCDTPGLLQAGESCRIPVYWAGRQLPILDDSIAFSITVSRADDTTQIDWDALQEGARPDRVDPAVWDVIWTNMETQVGSTWGDYIGMLNANAAYLGRLDQQVRDVDQLFGFELQQANNALHPLRQLASARDTGVPTPGLGLSFGRIFPNSITGRNQLGPLGRGWYHIWQSSLEAQPDGTLFITGPDGSQRRFQPNRRGQWGPNVYYSLNGDEATLMDNGDGTFDLVEATGIRRHFLADGKFGYVEDTNGNRITAGYSGIFLTSLTHSSGQWLSFTYNTIGLIETVNDSQGRSVSYTYDMTKKHLLAVQSYDGRTTHYTYSSGTGAAQEHALLSIEAPSGVRRFYDYDSQGRLERTFLDGNAEQVDFVYDSAGMVSLRNTFDDTAQVFFDHRGLPVRVTDPLRNVTNVTFDEEFNLTGIVDAAGLLHTYAYDEQANLTNYTDPLGQTMAFTYNDLFNQLESVTDARGNITSFDYDNDGNLLSTTYPNATVERLTYDALGNPLTFTNRRGNAIGFTYNADGQVTRKSYADGSQVSYTYDGRGNLQMAVDASGTMSFSYDAGDRLTRVTYPSGRLLAYTYDAAGRRTQMVDQDGFTVNYGYDSLSRLANLTNASGATIASYTYDAIGRLERKDLGNGTYTTYEYDAAGQVLHLFNYAPDGSINSRFDYTYNPLGRRSSMETLDGLWSYTYDANGQLTNAIFNSTNASIPDQDLTYEYDAVGNRLLTIENGVSTNYITNNMNQYTQVGTATLAYDADGNLISKIEDAGATTYTYDDENWLVGLETPGGMWSYEYDALGNRFSVNDNGQRTEYLLDPTSLVDVVGEYDAAGNVNARYVHGLGLISRVGEGNASYYDFDALGSTAGLTGPSGHYINAYNQLPFGRELSANEVIPNTFVFIGEFGVSQESDSLYFMRARYYLPFEGRFTSIDPIKNKPLGPYTYAKNNPLLYLDPLGLDEDEFSWRTFFETVVCGFTGSFCGVGLSSTEDTYKGVEGLVRQGRCGTANKSAARQLAELGFEGCNDPNDPHDPSDPNSPNGSGFGGGGGGAGGASGGGGSAGDTGGSSSSGGATGGSSPPGLPGGFGSGGSSGGVGSVDPNEKTGPVGFGPQRYVRPGGVYLYRIDFENDPEATAPAQRVDIFDQLDSNLDWSTLEFTEVGWNDTFIAVPPGRQYFFTTEDMNYNDRDFQVEVELQFDSLNGWIYASFRSLDPVSGLPPDALTGFLPPEDGTGCGQGHVNFIIQPRDGLATGTEIRNVAIIQFDYGEIIATNQIDPHDPSLGTDPAKEALVTVDADPPTSTVALLQATSPPTFTVSWSGDDGLGSGIAFYEIYVSEDDGAFLLWQGAVTTTTATYTGVVGSSYGFYSVATDNVGYQQPIPATAQTTTTVVLFAPDLAINKDDGRTTVLPGETLTYALSISNVGNQDATGVLVTDTLPVQGTTFVSASDGGSETGGKVTWPDFDLSAGDSVSRTITLQVDNPLPAGVEAVTNTATVADDGTHGPDPTPDNNTVSDTNIVDAAPDLRIIKDDGGISVAPGGIVTYTLTYTSAGNQDATGVVITETVPVSTTFNATASTPGWSCADGSPAGTVCIFTVSDLTADASGTVTFTVAVDDSLPTGVTEIANTAAIGDDGSNGADQNPDDNEASDTTPIGVVNAPPALTPIDDQVMDEGTTLDVAVSASDPDDDPIALSASGLPSFAALTDHGDGTGTLALAPGFDDAGVYPDVEITASDGSLTDTETFTVTVQDVNRPPVADDQAVTTDEDTPLNITLTASDPEGNPLVFAVVAGPANGSLSGTPPTLTYTPDADYNGLDSFVFTATDGISVSNTATVTITVNPVNDPPVAADDTATTNEDTAVVVSVLENDGDVDGDTLNVADVTQPAHGTVVSNPDGTVTYTPDVDFNGTDSFDYTVSDGVSTDAATVAITVEPVNDLPQVETGPDQAVDEGETVVFIGTFTDPDVDDIHTIAWDFGDEYTATGALTPTHTYADDGIYTVTLTVTDNEGAVGSDTLIVTVNNVAPTVDAGSDQITDEGEEVVFAGTFIDPGVLDTHTIAWDFGDGATTTGALTPTHIYAADGVYTVILTITDDDGGMGSDTLVVTVGSNTAPVVGAIVVPVDPIPVNTEISASAPFTDAGVLDTHTAIWDWGDGNTSSGTVEETGGSGTVSGNHTYTTPGVYTVRLVVTDDAGASGESIFQYVVAYDPTKRFVTGGGKIDSPEGAFPADPTLAGMANFGFNAKYKNSDAPTGQTEFQLKGDGFNFHSDAYEWLVVGTTHAWYKGTGTLDGEGGYQFMVTAIDAGFSDVFTVDRFRIKIWTEDENGTKYVVYDSGLGAYNFDDDATTELSGGSIVIHQK